MEEVAELVDDGTYINIQGSVKLKELLIKRLETKYSAYLVFKLKTEDPSPSRLNRESTAFVTISCDGRRPECNNERIVYLKTQGVQREGEKKQEWMEMKLGDISTTLGDDDDDDDGRFFQAGFYHRGSANFTGLIVKGIEFRPA